MALHDYQIVMYLDVINNYFEEEANQVVLIQRRHKELVWQDIFPLLEIDNPETQELPLLHLQQMLTTLQFYATEGLQFPTREAELEAVQVLFYDKANFHGVLNQRDCTHIPVQSPRGPNGELVRSEVPKRDAGDGPRPVLISSTVSSTSCLFLLDLTMSPMSAQVIQSAKFLNTTPLSIKRPNAKDMKLSSVLDPVVRCINKIQARVLNRREFRELLEVKVVGLQFIPVLLSSVFCTLVHFPLYHRGCYKQKYKSTYFLLDFRTSHDVYDQ
uniref:Uncharacterized protein n=1 Tax=Timema cristinae TaxID=61476 RepID=A0A7R9CZ39_TIMCR|nr:unnamed protein product [Timema cristinae]